MKHWHYRADRGVVRITAKSRPSEKTIPKMGVWPVQELFPDGSWGMPCFPEITWGTLKDFEFLGCVPVEVTHEIQTRS